MTIAVMQPYFLPYLGYWQLFAAVDRFVLLDDVNHIMRGWVNRNRLWVGGKEHWMTVPLANASQNRKISETLIVEGGEWKEKLMRTIQGAYGKAPFFVEGRDWISGILDGAERSLPSFLSRSLQMVAERLGIQTEITSSSLVDPGNKLRGEERILHLCERLGADTYFNLSGGRELYDPATFADRGIALRFLRTHWEDLSLSSDSGTPHLSILDLRMQNPTEALRDALTRCEFEA